MPTVAESLKIITIQPVEHDHHLIQWEVDTTQLGTGPFTFSLYRSGSPAGPWTLLDDTLTGNTYEDDLDLLHGMTKDIFYKIETTIGGDLYGSEPTSITTGLDKHKACIIKKILYDERKMLAAGNGVSVCVVKKRHWGTRCIRCYDACTGEIIKSNCTNCFGTTFEEGYFDPIETLMNIKPTVVGVDYNSHTSTPEVDTANAFLQNYPSVIRGDFVVEKDTNKRWEVSAVRPTEILRNTVHQDLTMSRLPTAHPIYKVAIP